MTLFDLSALFTAVDTARQNQGLSWAEVSRRTGVSASTIRRYQEAADAEADGVLAVVRWLGSIPEQYVTEPTATEERLPSAGSRYVRVDMDLVSAASGDSRGSAGRTRTTIQHLVEGAQRSRRSVASLTRVSDV